MKKNRPTRKRKDKQQNILVYCDESGNTGINICDESQPNFVQCAVVIPQDNVSIIIKEFEKVREICKAEEIKFKHLHRSTRFHHFEKFIRGIETQVPLVSFSIINKKFFAAMMIIEYMLDHYYNSSVPSYFQWGEYKKNLATILCKEVDLHIGHQFLLSLRSQNKEDLLNIKNHIVEVLSKSNLDTEKKKWFSQLSDASFLECCQPANKNHNSHCSPNFHSFSMLISCLNKFFIDKGYKKGVLISDNQNEFQESFEELNDFYNSDEPKVMIIGSNHISVGPFFVNGVEFDDSKNKMGIQLADLYASSCAWLLKTECPAYAISYRDYLYSNLLENINSGYAYYAT